MEQLESPSEVLLRVRVAEHCRAITLVLTRDLREGRTVLNGGAVKWPTERWMTQQAQWPCQGRHVMACFDAATVVVYQAYRPSIADAALEAVRLAAVVSSSPACRGSSRAFFG